MTEKKKPRGKPFEKGNKVAKTGGRPGTSPEEKVLKKLTKTEFQNIVHLYFGKKKSDLAGVLIDDDATVLESTVCAIMAKAQREGDEKKLNWFLEQIFGKLRENSSVDMKIKGDIHMTQGLDLSKLSEKELTSLEAIFAKVASE